MNKDNDNFNGSKKRRSKLTNKLRSKKMSDFPKDPFKEGLFELNEELIKKVMGEIENKSSKEKKQCLTNGN